MKQLLSTFAIAWCLFFTAVADNSLILHYDFNTVDNHLIDECDPAHFAVLNNQAEIQFLGAYHVLNLGESNGYLDMGTSVGDKMVALEDFSVATYYYIDESASVSGNGYFLWSFSTSASCGQYNGEYIAYRMNAQRYALSTGGWSNEVVGLQKGSGAEKGSWKHVVYTQKGNVGTIYLNGEVYVTGTASYQPKALSTAPTCNWIGRPPFSGDAYLKQTMLSDFRIYNKALSANEVQTLADTRLDSLNYWMGFRLLEQVAAALTLEDTTDIIADMDLPWSISGINISWASSHPDIISSAGKVSRPSGDTATVVLTATLSNGSITKQKSFHVTVLPYFDDATSVQRDLEAIIFQTDAENILKYNLSLPVSGTEGSTYQWSSSNTEYLSDDGKVLKFPAIGQADVSVDLNLLVSKGDATESAVYHMLIPATLDYYAYLFAYFTGNSVSQEAIRFAISFDGFNYKALNSDQPIISSDTISEMGGVRDPHIMRCMDDNSFYMVVTDMRSSNGWNSNHGMVLLKSDDLIHWQHTAVDVADLFVDFKDINRAWAPQTIYDQQTGKYMLYWSMRAGSDIDVIYYAYADKDFTTIETMPQVLFENPAGTACIDGDIIYKDGKYYMFYKTEGSGNGIKKVVSDNAHGPFVVESSKTLQSTTEAVEGSCVFKLYDSDTYILMYDLYTTGKYQFTQTTDLENFSVIQNTSMNFTPRHGTVIPITKEETRRLIEQWGDGFEPIPDEVITPKQSSKKKRLTVSMSSEDEHLYISSVSEAPMYVDVYGLSGECLLNSKLYTASGVDCTSLASGCYLLKATDGQGVMQTLFVKR